MTQRRWLTPVRVIADDFTGANDAGTGLAQAGARVNVLFDSESAPDPPGGRVGGQHRQPGTPRTAGRRADTPWRAGPRQADSGWLFKKIDSTLRGNLGVETEAALLACGAPRAVVPAVPAGAYYPRRAVLSPWQAADRHRICQRSKNPGDPLPALCSRLREQSDLTCGPALGGDRQPISRLSWHAIAQGHPLLVVDAETRLRLNAHYAGGRSADRTTAAGGRRRAEPGAW